MNDITPILHANISSLKKENDELKQTLHYIRVAGETTLPTPVTNYERYLVNVIRNMASLAGDAITLSH